jgi:hypothetical protein
MNVCPSSGPHGGAAGGSGGGGGCGGQGGKGGGYGGGSIAIIALEGTELTVEASRIVAGRGGKGGVGGTGQEGGYGNTAGQGGRLLFGIDMGAGCSGGTGGNGGRGGDAGGGLGGASIGIAYTSTYLRLAPDAGFDIAGAGDGGLAGNASEGDKTNKGGEGPAGFFIQFDVAAESPR